MEIHLCKLLWIIVRNKVLLKKKVDEKVKTLEVEVIEEVVEKPQGDRYELTYDAYQRLSSLNAIAKERGLTLATIITHLGKCAEKGMVVDWSKYIDHETEALIKEKLEDESLTKLKEVKDSLPDSITYETIHIVRAKYKI